MVRNVQIFKIFQREIIAFNQENYLIIIDNEIKYKLNHKIIILGILNSKLIALIKNKYIVSLNFPSFALDIVLYEGTVDGFTSSHHAIWFKKDNNVFCINSSMEITLFDDFTHLRLINIMYLHELTTLAFIAMDKKETKIHFDHPLLPSLIFPDISATPEISFESTYGIFISIGRSMFEYNITKKKLQIINKIDKFKLKWGIFTINIQYNITVTNIAITQDIHTQTYKIEGDVWRIINAGDAIYLLSDSINAPFCVHKINDKGILSRIYSELLHNYTCELENKLHQTPLLKFYPVASNNKGPTSAVIFAHGGPHQKAGNSWDSLFTQLLAKNYCVYVPQYRGTVGIDDEQTPDYGLNDFEDLLFHYDQIKKIHSRVILVGHSYGAFLALKLFFRRNVDLFIGINGVYDLLTISSLNPKTYAHLDEKIKIERSPQPIYPGRGEWHHIQFKYDPLIRSEDLKKSLSWIKGEIPKIHYLNFHGHGSFTSSQSSQIIELIDRIEHNFYKSLLDNQSHEQIYHRS